MKNNINPVNVWGYETNIRKSARGSGPKDTEP